MKHLLGSCLLVTPALLVGQSEAPEAPATTVQRQAHWVDVDGASIHTWEVAPRSRAGEPVVIFLHGGTWSGKPNFDLQFEDYSTMEHFAGAGWDTFAVDARGYGPSTDPEGESWSEASDAATDLLAVVRHIQEIRKVKRVHLVGWSWGSQVAALFAQRHPELTERVVLYGTRWQALEGAPDAPEERFRTSTIDDASTDFIEGCYDPALVDVYAKAAIEADPVSPNGVFRDYFEGLPIIEPEALTVPVLLICGEHEAVFSMEDLAPLFTAIAVTDKQLAVIPGGGHAVHLEKGRHRWRRTVLAFLGQAGE